MTDRILIRGCTLLSEVATHLLYDHFVVVEGAWVSALGPMAECPDPNDFQVNDPDNAPSEPENGGM